VKRPINNGKNKPPSIRHFVTKSIELCRLPERAEAFALAVPPPSTGSGRTDKTDHGELVEPCELCGSVVKRFKAVNWYDFNLLRYALCAMRHAVL
jgi:hypothetical protein